MLKCFIYTFLFVTNVYTQCTTYLTTLCQGAIISHIFCASTVSIDKGHVQNAYFYSKFSPQLNAVCGQEHFVERELSRCKKTTTLYGVGKIYRGDRERFVRGRCVKNVSL